MSKYDELKRLAEAQPNKNWSRDKEGRVSCSSGLRMYGVTGPQCVSDFEDWGFTREAASFIAAASPAAILELIAELEVVRDKASELSVEAVRYRYLATKTWSDDVTDALCFKDKANIDRAIDAAVLEEIL